MSEKTCNTCHTPKPLLGFHKSKASPDGYVHKCKECVKSYQQRHRKDNPDLYSERAAKSYLLNRGDRLRESQIYNRTPKGRESHNKATSRYERKNRAKVNARRRVSRAVQKGIILRPFHCTSCGRVCKPEGHHSDYLRPLYVEWVCSGCHAQRHFPTTR